MKSDKKWRSDNGKNEGKGGHNSLDGSRNSDREEGDLGVVPIPVPSCGFGFFLTLDGDGSILAEAGCDDDRAVVHEEPIMFPIVRGVAHPILVTFDDETIKLSEKFHIESYPSIFAVRTKSKDVDVAWEEASKKARRKVKREQKRRA